MMLSISTQILIAVTIILFILFVVFFDKKTAKFFVNFKYKRMPVLSPVPIPTKDRGILRGIWVWLTCSRKWELQEDFHFVIKGRDCIIPKGFIFDGASIPRIFWMFLSPVGILLIGGMIHDFGYKYQTYLTKDKNILGMMSQRHIDIIFREINISVNGLVVPNYFAFHALRLFGFLKKYTLFALYA